MIHRELVEVVAAVLRNAGTVMLCHRHPQRAWYPNVWDLPGGHIEPGEDAADALVRELFEELAVVVPRPAGAPFRRVVDQGVEMTIWLIDYSGPVVNTSPEEHDELRWFTIDEIAKLDLAHPSYVGLLKDALEHDRQLRA